MLVTSCLGFASIVFYQKTTTKKNKNKQTNKQTKKKHLKNKRICHEKGIVTKGSALAHTNCSHDVTYFMCSDPSKMEMKTLSELFPLGKYRNSSSRIRFVIFVTSGDGDVALCVLFSKIACCIQCGITPEATLETTYRRCDRSYSNGRKIKT